jgi:predicted permease
MKWLKQLFSRRRLYDELSEEIREHLEEKVEELVACGMSRKEAVAAARREFGNVSLTEQDSREVWRWPSIEDFFMDVRYGLRQLRKSPGFTAVAVLTLALGIGANTAIFSALDAVMLKSLPVYKPDQLVLFTDNVDQGWTSSNSPPAGKLAYFPYGLYTYFKNRNQTFQDICAFRNALDDVNVRVDGAGPGASVQPASEKQVSGNYFAVMGVNAVLGRLLTPSDDQPAAQPATVISFRYWSARFHRDASVLGRALEVNGVSFTIVGVAPPEFFGERVESNPADLWVPLAFQPRLMQRESWLENGDYYWLDLIGRLKQGVSIAQAQAGVNVQLHQFFTEQAGTHLSPQRQRDIDASKVELSPGARGISYLRLFYSEPLHILMGGVLIILLIACANVATLLLARAAGRRREISMRLALGAKRGRLIRQLLTESLLLAGLGAAAGGLFAKWGVNVLTNLVARNTPLDVSLDWRVLLFAGGMAVGSAVAFGLLPALRATRVDLTPVLKTSAFTSNPERPQRFGLARSLVAFQIACALPLLMGAALFVRSLQNLAEQNLGFSPEHVLSVGIDAKLAGYKEQLLEPLYKRLLDRVSTLPGVRSASLAHYSPLSGRSWSMDITIQGYTPRPGQDMNVAIDTVGPRYFETEGMPLLLGRPIAAQDVKGAPEVAVVNEAFARSFLSNSNPIGKRFGPGGDDPEHSGEVEIVGVVKDAKFFSLRDQPRPMVFLSIFQTEGDMAYGALEIRAAGAPEKIGQEVGQAVAEIDRNITVRNVAPLTERIHSSLNQERTISELSSFFGLLAVLLACLGLYGLMSYTVARQTNEIGVRMALGANQGDLVRSILGQGARLAFVGVALGSGAAFALMRLISNLLYGVSTHDSLASAGAVVLLMFVALLASYVPARQASRVDPIVALRYE